MPGLILEGGTFRPVFSCGVLDALLDEGLMFDYVSGVSAGITYAFSYLAGQRGRNLRIFTTYRNDKRYLSLENFPKCGSIFGLDFVFDEVPNRLVPFDWETFHRYRGRVRVGVTNALTGKAEYLDGMQLDRPCTMLRATCALPHMFPPIEINGTPYYDGGVADSIPIAPQSGCADPSGRLLENHHALCAPGRTGHAAPVPGHGADHAAPCRPLQPDHPTAGCA